MNYPLVTIMIPTRHRVEKLQKTLSQLYLSATEFAFEIILMGDEDDPETIKAFEELERGIQGIRTILTPRLGYTQLDSGYYARMEREARGEFVWIAGDDMLVYGDWFAELKKVPKTGFIVQPETSRLGESIYTRAQGQAFPIFPRFCWKQFQDTFPVPFDVNGDLLLRNNGWKTWFLEGVTMWHDRPNNEDLARHRRGDYYKMGEDGKWTRVTRRPHSEPSPPVPHSSDTARE